MERDHSHQLRAVTKSRPLSRSCKERRRRAWLCLSPLCPSSPSCGTSMITVTQAMEGYGLMLCPGSSMGNKDPEKTFPNWCGWGLFCLSLTAWQKAACFFFFVFFMFLRLKHLITFDANKGKNSLFICIRGWHWVFLVSVAANTCSSY